MRLGPEHRTFTIAMFYQLHCLRLISSGIAGDYRLTTAAHFVHCLTYIRQLVLCKPDLTLEPYDIIEWDFALNRDSSTHICHDWTQACDAMARNWDEWFRFRQHIIRSAHDQSTNTKFLTHSTPCARWKWMLLRATEVSSLFSLALYESSGTTIHF
ncbi:hypothetical protein BD413DRAFT_303677 [Trametes elegans]|nr:hypothetical protein BD413DRAFT_303677 [Trametes elegans]